MAQCPFEQAMQLEHRPDPYPFYASYRGAPTRLDDGRFVVGGYHDVLALLHDPRMSSIKDDPEAHPMSDDERAAVSGIIGLDPPDHDRIRRIMMRQFGPPRRSTMVADLEPTIVRIANKLIDGFAGNEVEVVSAYGHRLPIAIICQLLGIPESDEDRFHDWVVAITSAAGTQAKDEANKARQSLDAFLSDIADDRRGKPGDDMISGLVNDIGPDGPLPDGAVGATVSLLLIAGHETTVNLIANGVKTLLRHPDEIRKLCGDPVRATLVVEELLRLEPPVQFVDNRRALADVAVGGVTIPKGATAVLLVAGANRDPACFAEPNTFDPDRPDNNAHLGFGSGIHSCFGAPLARLEGQIALRLFFERLIAPSLVVDPPYRASPLLRGPSELRVAFGSIRPAAVALNTKC